MYVLGSLPPCSSILRSPTKLTVDFGGALHHNRWARGSVRHSVHFRLTEPDGVSLWLYKPNLRQVDCARMPPQEVESWVAHVEALLRQPGRIEPLNPTDEAVGEVLVVSRRQEQTALEVESLTPEGLLAVRELISLAGKAFGSPVERTILDQMPGIAERLESSPGSR